MKPISRNLRIGIKIVLTIGAFYLLLSHDVTDDNGQSVPIYQALREHLAELTFTEMAPFLLTATFIKFIGILSSMWRWRLLLAGQGIVFPFRHIFGSFLIGRFLGTFLPSTVGLDAYKLYDAARFSGRTAEPAVATAVEKLMGLSGVFLCFLVTLPLGYAVFGEHAGLVVGITVPLASAVIAILFLLMFKPGWVVAVVHRLPFPASNKIFLRVKNFVNKMGEAALNYRGKARLLAAVMALSFMVHFTTAAMYYFTALAVGVVQPNFWWVTLASTVQIFATVMSPFTIAGEGVREIVQALLLAKHMGLSASVLSAALGFWAAEALTLFGAVFLWTRSKDYRPSQIFASRT